MQKYHGIFVCILQGTMSKMEKENHATKVTKIQKTKRQKYGMNNVNNEKPLVGCCPHCDIL